MKTAALLFTLSFATAAQANPKPAEDVVEHLESRVHETSYTRTTTIKTPTRAVVERAWSSTYDEQWSSATYANFEWTTDLGHRSDEIREQKTTIRTRAKPIKVVPRPACVWNRCCGA